MEKFLTVKRYPYFLIGILVFLGLYLTSFYHYLLFHSLAELFNIVVACGIFMIAWNSRRFLENNYLLFIGIAYLFVAGIDLVHTLAYKGMGIFQGYETNLPTQLWIATRYVQSLSLFIAPFFFRRKLKINYIFLGYALATFVLLTSIFYWNIFPICFIEGVGLTPFKKISEYIISLILLGSIFLLLKNRREFDRGVLQCLILSIILNIVSELAFTFYVDAYGLSNLIGHFLEILSFYFIYKAIIQTGLKQPYDLMFRNLKKNEEALRRSRDELERRVEERTAELAKANEELQAEIAERKRAEEAVEAERQRFNDVLEMLPAYLVLLAPDYHVPFANRFFRERFGESHGRRCFEYLFGRSEPCEICETYTVLKTMAPHEWDWTGPDGRNYHVFDFPFTDTDGSTLILEMGIDITERKEIQRRIEASNAILDLFAKKSLRKEYFDGARELIQHWSGCRCVGIRVLNEKYYIPYESYVGFGQEFWEAENLLSVKYDQCACIRVVTGNPDPQDRSVMTPAGSFRCENIFEFVGNLSEGEKARFRGTCIKNGFKSIAIIPIRYRDKVIGAIHLADEKEGKVPINNVQFIESMAPLIGEAINRLNLEEELKDSEARLRILSSQLLTVQENERRRVAREIHDGIGQMLTAIKFKVEDITQQKETRKTKAKEEPLEVVIPMIRESIEEVRRIQMDLRPSTLDDLGILATIDWFCREFEKIYSTIRTEKLINIHESEVPTYLKTVIFRVMQESLNNIAKHSKADWVHLSLKKKEDRIELVVEDNGTGFDLEKSKKGFGLSSMRERTELSGGAFRIETTSGAGTTIHASWPLS
jgi:signal transduction histidine kinase/PAS domain-containing protein